jgi:hypothetical protein
MGIVWHVFWRNQLVLFVSVVCYPIADTFELILPANGKMLPIESGFHTILKLEIHSVSSLQINKHDSADPLTALFKLLASYRDLTKTFCSDFIKLRQPIWLGLLIDSQLYKKLTKPVLQLNTWISSKPSVLHKH